jgi:hypothetical protein
MKTPPNETRSNREASERRLLPAGVTRRHILRAGSCGLLGLGLGQFGGLASLASSVGQSGPGKAKSVILIFNGGAPSHLDLWDPKPDAPAEIRGVFSAIKTNVPGIHITELLPRMARRMDKVAIVRSVYHEHGQHNAGMYWATAGRPFRIDSTLINPSRSDLPSFGTLVGWLAQRDGFSGAVPPYVITPFPTCDSTAYITPGQLGGCLGPRFDPFVLDADPNAAGFTVRNMSLDAHLTAARLAERRTLLEGLDRSSPTIYSPDAAQPRRLQMNKPPRCSSLARRRRPSTFQGARCRARALWPA